MPVNSRGIQNSLSPRGPQILRPDEKRVEFRLLGVGIEPGFDALHFCQSIGSELFREQLLMLFRPLGFGDVGLPAIRKDKMQIIVQSGIMKVFPFVLIQPDPAAAAATVDEEIEPMPRFDAGQKPAAGGTEFARPAVVDGPLRREIDRLIRSGMVFPARAGFKPFPIPRSVDPPAVASRAA